MILPIPAISLFPSLPAVIFPPPSLLLSGAPAHPPCEQLLAVVVVGTGSSWHWWVPGGIGAGARHHHLPPSHRLPSGAGPHPCGPMLVPPPHCGLGASAPPPSSFCPCIVPPMIHPPSSCLWGWGQMVCHLWALVPWLGGAAMLVVIIVPGVPVIVGAPFVIVVVVPPSFRHLSCPHSTYHPPYEQLLVRLEVGGVSSSGGGVGHGGTWLCQWVLLQWPYAVLLMSAVMWQATGVWGVCTWWISPSRGLPASLCILLAHVNGLTSHLNGEEGVCVAMVGRGSSHAATCR